MEKIAVTVNKSHLTAIGERLYSENVELLRELVNNAYDADAEHVKIAISEDTVVVEDDGSGMDMEGIQQYFNIGSPYKKENPKSRNFGRTRIGEFGIGKFSVLSNCRYFEVFTKKGDFAGKAVFDKSEWEKHSQNWELPFSREPADGLKDGTKVALKGIKKAFDEETIKRLAFGLDSSILPRVNGEVNCDFLPLTSDRSDFLRDTPEYEVFLKVMERAAAQVREELNSQTDRKENSRVKRVLKEVTNKIETALLNNRQWCPPGLLPVGELPGGDAAGISEYKTDSQNLTQEEITEKVKKPRKKEKRPRLRRLSPSAFIKKMKIGQMNLALVMDHFGADGPESFIEGEVIYINRDHPLYVRESKNRERCIMNIARLICQEISLLSKPKDPRQAYERQSKLLRDSFVARVS